MSRSLWKGPYVSASRSSSRASTILPIHLGKIFNIHNGRKNIKITIVVEMIGHKFGEFVPTKTK